MEVKVFGTLCINQFVIQYTSQDCSQARRILIGRVLASHWSNKGLKRIGERGTQKGTSWCGVAEIGR